MAFSKSFPRTLKGSTYPRWEEIFLTENEELLEEQRCKIDNISIMKESIDDAKKIMADKDLKRYQTDLISVAIALFEKRASHAIHCKERKAKEKFDELFNK